MGQRRCERAIALLKEAGFMRVKQPRRQNEEGAYFGCRAIRIVTETLFECLGLGPMLRRERARASERLRRKAQKTNRKLADFMRRLVSGPTKVFHAVQPSREQEQQRLAWNKRWADFVLSGLEADEAQRRTNEAMGYPSGYSPGQKSLRR